MIMLRRLAAVFLTLVAALFTFTTAGTAVPHVASGLGTYAYGSHQHPTGLADTTTERGPPSSYDQATLYDAVDGSPNGASARPEVVIPGATTRYTTPVRFTQVPLAATSTGARVVAGGDLLSRGRSGVATKAAGDDWPILSGIVRDAGRGKGNFGLGEGTLSQANRAGESWVGDGYRVASDGKTLVSRDGLRTFRPPAWKPNLGKYQANFEYWLEERVGKPFGNGHLDITDMGP